MRRKTAVKVFVTIIAILCMICLAACIKQKDTSNTDNSTSQESDKRENTIAEGSESITDSAHKHIYGDWQILKNPSCTGEGEKIRTCECGQIEKEALPLKDHTEVVDSSAKAPTCTET